METLNICDDHANVTDSEDYQDDQASQSGESIQLDSLFDPGYNDYYHDSKPEYLHNAEDLKWADERESRSQDDTASGHGHSDGRPCQEEQVAADQQKIKRRNRRRYHPYGNVVSVSTQR